MPLNVRVVTPNRVLHDGPLEAVASVNDTGAFSILPQHTNFITIVKDHVTLYAKNQPPRHIAIEQGVAAVKGNDIEIFIGIKGKLTPSPVPAPAATLAPPGASPPSPPAPFAPTAPPSSQ